MNEADTRAELIKQRDAMRKLNLKRLGDIFTFKNGRAFKKSEWSEDGLPIIRIKNLNDSNAPFNHFEGQYDSAIEVNSGDLLFSWSGTVGSSFGSHIWDRDKGVLNQHIFKVGFKEVINLQYAYYALAEITAEIEKSVKGAVGLVHVTKSSLNEFQIPLPPLAEQERIVSILDKAFEGIDKAIAQTEQNLASARELFESYLNNIFTQKGEDWVEKKLGDIVDRLTNGYVGPTRDIYVEEGVPYLLARHVKSNILTFDGRTYVSAEFNNKNKKSLLKRDDVLLVQSGHIGHSAVVSQEHEGHNCHAMIVITTKKETISGKFLSAYFQSPEMKKIFQTIRTGSTVPHLTCKLVKLVNIPVPSLAVQSELVLSVEESHKKTKTLEALYTQKLNDLEELKQSLLQQAFAGELTKEDAA